ncbi:hypothetical protein AN958_05218 [Leucoagaricus sp. SymC.cos]|nr:hypothetical protein AN958_05218 [Leucoagaricus sp. SymC.cos]
MSAMNLFANLAIEDAMDESASEFDAEEFNARIAKAVLKTPTAKHHRKRKALLPPKPITLGGLGTPIPPPTTPAAELVATGSAVPVSSTVGAFANVVFNTPRKTFGPDGLSRQRCYPGDKTTRNFDDGTDHKGEEFELTKATSETSDPLPLDEFCDDIDTRAGFMNEVAQGIKDFMTNGDVKKWYWFLYHIMWANCIIIRKGTECSPYFMVTGVHSTLSLDIQEATWLVNYSGKMMFTEDLISLRAMALAKHVEHVEAMHLRANNEKLA